MFEEFQILELSIMYKRFNFVNLPVVRHFGELVRMTFGLASQALKLVSLALFSHWKFDIILCFNILFLK